MGREVMILTATGDLLPTHPFAARPEPGFRAVLAAIAAADVALTNLECPVYDGRGYPAAQSGGIWPYAGPWAGAELARCGFHMVGLANNHTMDFVEGGLTATCQSLADAGLAWAGAGRDLAEARRPAYHESPVGRVAMVAAASTFPAHARAGAARHDFRGRPGVNPLRLRASYPAPADLVAALGDLARRHHLAGAAGPVPGETAPAGEAACWFAGQHLHVGPPDDVTSAADPDDLAGNLAAVREAARQADWVVVQIHSHEAHPDRDRPPAGLRSFCRACIDAGAHAVIGHGPHRTRGIELYRGWPILYSLGDFLIQNETTPVLPDDAYRIFGLGAAATPADLFDARSEGDRRGFPADVQVWQTVLPMLTLGPEGLQAMSLTPLTLGRTRPRPQRGLPEPAVGAEAAEILGRVAALSAELGTQLALEGGRLGWNAGSGSRR
jgi:poly-gamma-glutamate capsule biosynthesis protein CapA/YwtB (metallophosphatase superfamily)